MDTQLFSILSAVFGFVITLLTGALSFFLKDVFARVNKIEGQTDALRENSLIQHGEIKRMEAVNTQILQHINDKLETIEETLKELKSNAYEPKKRI